jgi:hypothetical protein
MVTGTYDEEDISKYQTVRKQKQGEGATFTTTAKDSLDVEERFPSAYSKKGGEAADIYRFGILHVVYQKQRITVCPTKKINEDGSVNENSYKIQVKWLDKKVSFEADIGKNLSYKTIIESVAVGATGLFGSESLNERQKGFIELLEGLQEQAFHSIAFDAVEIKAGQSVPYKEDFRTLNLDTGEFSSRAIALVVPQQQLMEYGEYQNDSVLYDDQGNKIVLSDQTELEQQRLKNKHKQYPEVEYIKGDPNYKGVNYDADKFLELARKKLRGVVKGIKGARAVPLSNVVRFDPDTPKLKCTVTSGEDGKVTRAISFRKRFSFKKVERVSQEQISEVSQEQISEVIKSVEVLANGGAAVPSVVAAPSNLAGEIVGQNLELTSENKQLSEEELLDELGVLAKLRAETNEKGIGVQMSRIAGQVKAFTAGQSSKDDQSSKNPSSSSSTGPKPKGG